jgi:geranylgeranyl pyrophosphate synthase
MPIPVQAEARIEISGRDGLGKQIAVWQTRIEQVLATSLASTDPAVPRLHEAMRYSVLGGGKRLRPLLVYITGQTFSAPPQLLDAPAAAVELIHAYSLIHDDLPPMDNDDLRRGRPSCHRAFDEGTAVLAGDALQALAFEVLAVQTTALSDSIRVQMLQVLAQAIGTEGMAGGQGIDLAAVGRPLSETALEIMHRRKTGALIRASVELGALAAGCADPESRQQLRRYGDELGLAFQIQDDILDVTAETAAIGKPAGSDAALAKPTYPSILGLARSEMLARVHRDRAIAAIADLLPAAEPMIELARYIVPAAGAPSPPFGAGDGAV